MLVWTWKLKTPIRSEHLSRILLSTRRNWLSHIQSDVLRFRFRLHLRFLVFSFFFLFQITILFIVYLSLPTQIEMKVTHGRFEIYYSVFLGWSFVVLAVLFINYKSTPLVIHIWWLFGNAIFFHLDKSTKEIFTPPLVRH